MIVTNENQRLYLRTYDYNVCRVISALADLIEVNGGKVKPNTAVIISDRNNENEMPIKVKHTSYLRFSFEGMVYYFQIDDNIFTPAFYTKTPVKNGNYFSQDAYLEEMDDFWKTDDLLKTSFTEEKVKQTAQIIFENLIKAPVCKIAIEYEKKCVQNIFNND